MQQCQWLNNPDNQHPRRVYSYGDGIRFLCICAGLPFLTARAQNRRLTLNEVEAGHPTAQGQAWHEGHVFEMEPAGHLPANWREIDIPVENEVGVPRWLEIEGTVVQGSWISSRFRSVSDRVPYRATGC